MSKLVHPDLEPESFFSFPPILPRAEMCAYESLWLGQGAWFANIANLFRDNPGQVPSELVPPAQIELVCERLKGLLGDQLSTVGIRVNGSNEYPQKLRDADHPVELLYFQGNWELVESPSVAVVGTRTPSEEGVTNARRVAAALVKNGYTVVSGLAKGIDTAAHQETIRQAGKTIAVIGTPLFQSYPKENDSLQREIAKDHLVVSQVPFLRYDQQHYKFNSLFFPARNITMSALTKATVIVEAGNTSGTLVQARAALAQNRKLFILESCFRNKSLSWPEKFEKLGAIRVQSIADMMDALKDADEPATDDARASH
jgi:DNA processing protein